MSAMATLRPGHTRALDEQWRDVSVDDAAVRVGAQLSGAACVLPLTVFGGARVYPVVAWDGEALRVRLSNLSHPLLNAESVLDAMADPEVPTVMSMVAFIGVGPIGRVRGELAGLRGLARTVGMFASWQRWSGVASADFDAQGSALVTIDETGTPVVRVGGDGSARAGSDLAPAWRRLFEEKLFSWALLNDKWPEP